MKKLEPKKPKLITHGEWTPVRNGNVYCAPACGRGCTIDEYLDAVRRGNALAEWLGRSWVPEVFENLGWHVHVLSGCRRIRVTENKHGKRPPYYTAFLDTPDRGGARFVGQATKPHGAVNLAVRKLHEAIKELQEIGEGLL